MKTTFKHISALLFLSIIIMQPLFAADNCGNLPPCYYSTDVPYDTCCPVAVPFDEGIILMLAAGGIGMGIRAMRKRKILNAQ